jgi:hypothetical protein
VVSDRSDDRRTSGPWSELVARATLDPMIRALVAILVGVGVLWAMTGLVPPSKDTTHTAFEQDRANGSTYFDAEMYTVWSVPGLLGHTWTCKVHIDSVADPDFIAHGFYECSPWPWAANPGTGRPIPAQARDVQVEGDWGGTAL